MVREAEENREADQGRREIVDTRNNLDALILASEKMIKEDTENKIDDASKKELEEAVTEAKTKLESQTIDELKAATERLQNVSHKIASAMYEQSGGPQGGPGPQPGAEGQGPEAAQGQNSDKNDDDVVDADFKEV